MKLGQIGLALLAGLAISVAAVSGTWAQPGGRSDPQSDAERRALFLRGAQLWPVYCNTCHNARPGAEFSPAEWGMIMMHMRTQANLPANDARAVLEYLRSSR
jgi:mono/diheme cytochrome c family protein